LPILITTSRRECTLGIRARAAVFVAITMILLAVMLLLLAGSTLTATFDHLERRDGQRSMKLVQNWMLGQSQEQARNAQSYGAWNATYKFITDHNRAYIAGNMTNANLASIHADFFVFVDSAGRIVYSKFVREISMRSQVLDYVRQAHALQVFGSTLSVNDNVVGLPDVVVAIGATPIVTSQSKGPARGSLISGRFLDDTTMLDASRQIGESVVWYPKDRQPLSGTDYQRLLGGDTPLLQQIAGETVGWGLVSATIERTPAAVVRVPIDVSIAAEGANLRRYTAVGLAMFIVVSILVLVVVLDTSVLRRLLLLTKRVRQIGRSDIPGNRVEVRGRDEIGKLATDINGMLESIDRSREQLIDLAAHDSLTGLFNRRRFDEELARELAESKRLQRGGALLWFDLDNFKRVNDTHGHSVGDEVLISFAELLKSESRAYSALARFGGDEFVMLVPGADHDEAMQAAERLLELVGSHIVAVGGASVRLAMSVGVALYPRDGDTVEALLGAADTAMYESKRTGRGRVTEFTAA
jgi:diguanylate cyclase (GGDEF)-like protein